jgi:hypothetical protein
MRILAMKKSAFLKIMSVCFMTALVLLVPTWPATFNNMISDGIALQHHAVFMMDLAIILIAFSLTVTRFWKR